MSEQPTSRHADDAFKLDEDYDLEIEYTRSTNKKGFGESIYVKVAPEIAGALGSLVASRKIPELRTVQDAVRSAIVHRLHHWAEAIEDGQLHRIVLTEMQMCKTEAYIDEMKALEARINALKEAGSLAVQNSDWSMLVALIMEARESARYVREPYASRLEAEAHEFERRMPAQWKHVLEESIIAQAATA